MKRVSLKRHLVRSLIVPFVFLALFLPLEIIFTPRQLVGNGMQNTLNDGQSFSVNRIAYLFHGPKRGDIIDFYDPTGANREWIKRVIGLPGDVIALNGRGVSVNGVRLTEPYVTSEYNTVIETVKVPSNAYFVLGDNRRVSKDSRFFGFVPRKNIVGQVVPLSLPDMVLVLLLGIIGAVVCLRLFIQYRKTKRARFISALEENASEQINSRRSLWSL